MRIAAVTAWRHTGSPERATKRRRAPPRSPSPPGRTVGAQQPAGQHQGPGRGVDEERAGMAEMALPIGGGDLVADQPVDGLGIGNAQQRLGEAHQRDALRRGQRIFLQERVEPAFAETLAAHRHDQPARGRGDPVARFGGISAAARIAATAPSSLRRCAAADRRAQRRLRRRRGRENQLHCSILSSADDITSAGAAGLADLACSARCC